MKKFLWIFAISILILVGLTGKHIIKSEVISTGGNSQKNGLIVTSNTKESKDTADKKNPIVSLSKPSVSKDKNKNSSIAVHKVMNNKNVSKFFYDASKKGYFIENKSKSGKTNIQKLSFECIKNLKKQKIKKITISQRKVQGKIVPIIKCESNK
jgi:hypothetical protein